MIREKTLPEIKAKRKDQKKETKKNLRTMQRTRVHHPIREGNRIIKYGFSGFKRNIWLSSAAIIVMAFTLIVLFATVIAGVVLTNTANEMREKIDITIYLKPNTSKNTLDELANTISTDKNVKSVSVSTSEEMYQKLLEEEASDDDIAPIIDDEEMREIMIAGMQAVMRVKVYDVDDTSSLEQIVATDPGFIQNLDDERRPTFDTNQTEISTITSWANIASMGGIILGAVFLLISIMIIFSTIRMAIFSRREEVYMMKLVGAGKRFIRGPFLVEAEISGAFAGIIAGVISYFGFNAIAPSLETYGINVSSIMDIMASNQLVLVFVCFIVIGVLIGGISARLAVSKYLNKA